MRIPIRWLFELVETDRGAAEVAERLTMAGIEAVSLPPIAPDVVGVVAGEVLEVVPHPAGGALSVCQVSTGTSRYRVVCGAPNVRAGQRAAFARPGARLPGDRRIEVAPIKGTPSEGMLCSEAELHVGEDASAIMVLSPDTPLGTDLAAFLELADPVLEIEVTPNRPDCLSIIGVAREVAALTGGRLRPPAVTVRESGPSAAEVAAVAIEEPDLCPRYAARVVSGVTVGPSPSRLAQRLRAAGLRPINNVVDVTNYVLWELGHPLHAFDGGRLAGGRIVVRRARPPETLVTLDGQARALAESMLVIADAERAVAIAGVMGGADSEVGAATRTVLLESACFAPGSVRRTARALGMSTEASYRFERGADIEGLRDALDRAAQMIADLGRGEVAPGVLDVYPRPRAAVSLTLRLARVRRVAGACPPEPRVGRILRGLGFGAEPCAEGFQVTVPAFRRDVSLEDDLVEEVIRVWGYGEIPSTLPAGTLTLTRRPRHLVAQDAVRRALVAAGCHEAVTLSLVDPAYLVHGGLGPGDARVVTLQNPLASDRSVLRPTLLFGLCEAIATNVRRQTPDVRLFEIGRVFEGQDGDRLPREETRVGLALTGLREPRAWFGGRGRVDVHDARGLVETITEALGRSEVSVEALAVPHLEEERGVRVLVQGVPVGWMGELSPAVRQTFDLPAPVVAAELSLERLDSLPGRVLVHRTLPRFPAVPRDLAVVVDARVPAQDVTRAILDGASPALRRVSLFDVYAGQQVGPGRKSLAYALSYQAEDRTLTDEEVNAMHDAVVERLRTGLGAEVRGTEGDAHG